MNRKFVFCLVALVALLGLATTAQADHAWSTYHWARTTASFDLIIINSTTSTWDPYVSQAISDWSDSSVLNMIEDPNGSTASKDRRRCQGGDGTVRICNLEYGNTGWLGIAGISIDSNSHITTGYTKLNDTYYSPGSYYDNPQWRLSVTCQELGHNVGLGHQDEDFNNQSLFSCMDYQDPPYEFPNAHDYDQLEAMYDHIDSYDSYATDGGGDSGGGNCNPNSPKCSGGSAASVGWGMSLGRQGQQEVFIRVDPDGTQHITHVLWADGHHGDDGHDH